MPVWILALLAALLGCAGASVEAPDRRSIAELDKPGADAAIDLPRQLHYRSAAALMYWPHFDQRKYGNDICTAVEHTDYVEGEEPDESEAPIDLRTVVNDGVWDRLNDHLSQYAADRDGAIQRIYVEPFRVVVFTARSSARQWPAGTTIVSVSEYVLSGASPPRWEIADSSSLSLC